VRHRIASFSQQSQRYVQMSDVAVVVPPSVASSEEASAVFYGAIEEGYQRYKRLLELGVSREDARYVLPHGWETKLVLTMNARELHHFFTLRLCRRAQWEIRNLAREMLRRVRAVAPILFALAGPSCVISGACRERHSCGRPFGSMEELLEHEDA
jgi:thymidylate synthase (FAD)